MAPSVPYYVCLITKWQSSIENVNKLPLQIVRTTSAFLNKKYCTRLKRKMNTCTEKLCKLMRCYYFVLTEYFRGVFFNSMVCGSLPVHMIYKKVSNFINFYFWSRQLQHNKTTLMGITFKIKKVKINISLKMRILVKVTSWKIEKKWRCFLLSFWGQISTQT